MRFFITVGLCITCSSLVQAQEVIDTTPAVLLDDVVVKAFEQNKKLQNLPAAVNYIGVRTLQRFAPTSVVHAINTAPGVRMEERSPGSYRFNIRGSALRSPFGVRNVKVYYNDIPYTNPGGHTYLNQLGYYNFKSVEIIKGPGSSLYGVGTGGVLLIESLGDEEKPGVLAEYAAGSYNGHNVYGQIQTGEKDNKSKIGFQHQQNDGYRDHSELRRDILSWTGHFAFDKDKSLKTTFLYGDLEYETPGALTLSEFEKNPKASRPGSPFFPGAAVARAGIYQKTILAGASYAQKLASQLKNQTTFYGAYTQLLNPTVQNYGRSSEPHFGGRTIFTSTHNLDKTIFTFNGGAEWQQGYTNVSIHKNVGGIADSIRSYDEIKNRQSIFFIQASADLEKWTVMAGTSYNVLKLNLQRFIPRPLPLQHRTFKNKFIPRVALLRKLKNVTIYSSVSKGFSPPTTEELLPTGGDINLALNAEEGVNYDVGFRTKFKALSIDVNAFSFSLKNTIVTRRTAGGGNFYVNAGSTSQKGVETSINYPLFMSKRWMESSTLWFNHTFHHFQYKNFVKDTVRFSGNALPGVPRHVVASGFDFLTRRGYLATVHYFFNARVPLNDANAVYANEYHLVGVKVGFQKRFGNTRVKLFAGADNLLDQKYSLGNDINGFGGRYFNAAAGRNYYAALVFEWLR